MLSIEAVLALDDAGVQRQSQGPGRPGQAVGDLKVRHRGKFQRRVFPAGMLKANGAGGHHDVPRLHIQVDAAAGPGADKGIRTALVQLLHGNGRGGAADPRGAGGHFLSQQRAGPDIVFPVAGHLAGVVKQRRDGGHPSRIARQDTIASHVAGGTGDVILFFKHLHTVHLIFFL